MEIVLRYDFRDKHWHGKAKHPCGTRIKVKRKNLSEFEELLFNYEQSVQSASQTITEFRRPKKEEFDLQS